MTFKLTYVEPGELLSIDWESEGKTGYFSEKFKAKRLVKLLNGRKIDFFFFSPRKS